MSMTVNDLQIRLAELLKPNERGISKVQPDTPVIIESEHGSKHHLLTAKGRVYRAGHQHETICWLLIGDKFGW